MRFIFSFIAIFIACCQCILTSAKPASGILENPFRGAEKMDWVQTKIRSYLQKPHRTRNPLPLPGKCGWRKIHRYIVGGENALRGEWPWQIGLYLYGRFSCGGSLISHRWILTAAHCVNDPEIHASNYSVVVGDYNKEMHEGTEKTIKVKQIIKHAGFWKNAFFDKDIALLELEEPVQFNRYIQPVCLPESGEEVPVGSRCYITGWGKTDYMGETHPILQKAKLPPVSDEECIKKVETSPVAGIFEITENMLCAGVESTILSGCHGDSGGPYVCQMEDGHWVLQGAVSWGSASCDANENFTVFAKISALRDWINDKIGYLDEDQDIYT